MNDNLEQKLIKIDPVFFECYHGDVMHTCMHFGCECGDGWFEPLKQLVEKIAVLNTLIVTSNAKIVADQIKEKFGELRCYTSIKLIDESKPVTNTNLVNTVSIVLNDIISAAENQCWNVCEICGCKDTFANPLITTSGWISRICTDCSIKNYYNSLSFTKDHTITNFNDCFEFLNPTYETSFKYKDDWYNSYFQCYYCNLLPNEYKQSFKSLKNNQDLFNVVKIIKLNKHIQDDYNLAKDILLTIFSKTGDYSLLVLLNKTLNYQIKYLNRSCDNTWGQCLCDKCKEQHIIGQNMWGVLLTQVREELRK